MEDKRRILKDYIKKQITHYNVYRNGHKVEEGLLGWATALARARKWRTNLFDERQQKVEILNTYTAEIISLEDAEIRAAKYAKRSL